MQKNAWRSRCEHGCVKKSHTSWSKFARTWSYDLAGVQSLGGKYPVQTEATLDARLVAASAKLAEGKFEDAIAKRVDSRTSVDNLAIAPKPKISQKDAQLLIADANNAIACIQGLIMEG